MAIEVEVKAKLDTIPLQKMREMLVSRGAKMSSVLLEEDVYLSSPTRDFRRTDEALRVRTQQVVEDNSEMTVLERAVYLTYKGPKLRSGSKSRRELEVLIEGGSPSSMIELLGDIGFSEAGSVSKKRYQLDYGGYRILLDDVSGLGEFIEIEHIAEGTERMDEIVQEMKELIPELTDGKWIEISYLELSN